MLWPPAEAVDLFNRAADVLALPVHETVAPDTVPFQVQFWLLLWLLWISTRVFAPVNATVGVTPLSYWWLACQVISPSAPSCPTWYQSVEADCDWCTSTSCPASFRATSGVVPLSYLPCRSQFTVPSAAKVPVQYQSPPLPESCTSTIWPWLLTATAGW